MSPSIACTRMPYATSGRRSHTRLFRPSPRTPRDHSGRISVHRASAPVGFVCVRRDRQPSVNGAGVAGASNLNLMSGAQRGGSSERFLLRRGVSIAPAQPPSRRRPADAGRARRWSRAGSSQRRARPRSGVMRSADEISARFTLPGTQPSRCLLCRRGAAVTRSRRGRQLLQRHAAPAARVVRRRREDAGRASLAPAWE